MVMLSASYTNPYDGSNFFEFIAVFFHRMYLMLFNEEAFKGIVSDELQFFVLGCVALSSSLVGCFLVLRRMTMLANALSHTVLFGIILSFVLLKSLASGSVEVMSITQSSLPLLLLGALFSGILTTFLTQLLTKNSFLKEDASIGLVFSLLFSLGVILATLLTRSAHVGIEIVMGNVDALHAQDLKISFYSLVFNLILLGMFFKEYHLLTFDSLFAKSVGIRSSWFNYLLMFQVSVTCVSAFRAVGVLMVLTLMVSPVLVARIFAKRLQTLLIISSLFSLFCCFCGVALSRHLLSVYSLPLSTGGITVSLFCILTLISHLLFAKNKSLKSWCLRKF
jgi:manganese/zinc/iron transport system permease protein